MDEKERFIGLLRSTKREGIDDLIKYLESTDFFFARASSRFHGAHVGGLLHHSLLVYDLFSEFIRKFRLNISDDSIIISALLHDVCKIGLYINGSCNRSVFLQGHGTRSLELIRKHIVLNSIEEYLIRYHMGFWYSKENSAHGEYRQQELVDSINKLPIISLFHYCDDISTKFME